jgi:hypothetical protein
MKEDASIIFSFLFVCCLETDVDSHATGNEFDRYQQRADGGVSVPDSWALTVLKAKQQEEQSRREQGKSFMHDPSLNQSSSIMEDPEIPYHTENHHRQAVMEKSSRYHPYRPRTGTWRRKFSRTITPAFADHALVLRNISFPHHNHPSSGFPLMSYVSFWIEQHTGYGVLPWAHLHNARYIRQRRRKRGRINRFPRQRRCVILIELVSSDMVQTLLQSVLENGVPEQDGILEPYFKSHEEKRRNRTLHQCMKTLRLFGHTARLHSTDENALIVDDHLIYRYHPENGQLMRMDET